MALAQALRRSGVLAARRLPFPPASRPPVPVASSPPPLPMAASRPPLPVAASRPHLPVAASRPRLPVAASRPRLPTPSATSYGSFFPSDLHSFGLMPKRCFSNLSNHPLPNERSSIFKVAGSTWEFCKETIKAKWGLLSPNEKFSCQLGFIFAGFQVLLALLFYYSTRKTKARVESKFKVHEAVINSLKHQQEVDGSKAEHEAAERRSKDARERRREADERAEFAAQQISHMGAQLYNLQKETAELKIALLKLLNDRGGK